MQRDVNEVEAILQRHRDFHGQRKQGRKNRDAAYATRFWKDGGGAGRGTEPSLRSDAGTSTPLVAVEKNRLNNWLSGIVASLFYRRLHVVVTPEDQLDGEKASAEDATTMSAAFDYWLSSEEVAQQMREATRQALHHEGCGMWFSVRSDAKSAFRQVRVDVIPDDEFVYDRRCARWEDVPYVGRLSWKRVDWLRKQSGAGWDLPDRFTTATRPAHRLDDADTTADDEQGAWVQVLELYDFVGTFHLEVKLDKEGDAKRVTEPGRKALYVLNQVRPEDDKKRCPLRVFEGPIEIKDDDGRPANPALPVILDSLPGRPLEGLASSEQIYHLNREENLAMTAWAQAFRFDQARKYGYDASAIDRKSLDDLKSGADSQFVKITNGEVSKAVAPIPVHQPPITTQKYIELLDQSINEAGGTSPVTRGESRQYVTATQDLLLNDYTETKFGEFRSITDHDILRMCRIWTYYQRELLTKPVRFQAAGEVYQLAPDQVKRRWRLQMADTPTTPAAESARRNEWKEASTQLSELMSVVGAPPESEEVTPMTRAFAETAYEYTVDLYKLPDSFRLEVVRQAAEAQPVPPEPEPEVAEARVQGDQDVIEEILADPEAALGAAGPGIPPEPGV